MFEHMVKETDVDADIIQLSETHVKRDPNDPVDQRRQPNARHLCEQKAGDCIHRNMRSLGSNVIDDAQKCLRRWEVLCNIKQAWNGAGVNQMHRSVVRQTSCTKDAATINKLLDGGNPRFFASSRAQEHSKIFSKRTYFKILPLRNASRDLSFDPGSHLVTERLAQGKHFALMWCDLQSGKPVHGVEERLEFLEVRQLVESTTNIARTDASDRAGGSIYHYFNESDKR